MPYTKGHIGLSGIADTIGTAVDVASDPYMGEVVCRVGQLRDIERGNAVRSCNKTPSGLMGGVGMRALMPAFRGYVYAQRNPWVYPAAALVAVGVPFALGFLFGRNAS